MNGRREVMDGRPWVCTEEQQAWLDSFDVYRPRWVTGLFMADEVTDISAPTLEELRKATPVRGIEDITFHRYEPLTVDPDVQRQNDLAERFIREGGTVYRDGKPWAIAAPAEPKDDEPGGYVSQLTPIEEDLKAVNEFGAKYPGCCSRCGWHTSSHGNSGYGPDCPWGISPAAAAGDLPAQPLAPDA